ncbi:PIN domain-containing protein [Metallibacterium sp.]
MMDDLRWGNIRSETLAFLRTLEWAKQFVGTLAQFVIVVDANVVLCDLIWLASRRRNPTATTSVMECIVAGTFVAYISGSALSEIEEHIPRIARENNLPLATLRAEWKQYRKLLKKRTPKQSIVDRYRDGRDPDDAPHLALAEQLDAAGILSNDTDLVAMGGRVLEMEFSIEARYYSRKMAVAVSMKVLGVTAILGAVTATKIIGELAGEAIRLFARLPPAYRLLILIAILLLANNERVQDGAKKTFSRIRDALAGNAPGALEFISKASETYSKNVVPPPQLKYRS